MWDPRPPMGRTWDACLAREADQPIRYARVDGQVHAMGGGTADRGTIGTTLGRFAASPAARTALI